MGTTLNTFHVVAPPASTPYRFGLFSVAEPRSAQLEGVTLDEHWRLGVTWRSQNCSTVKTTTGPCIDEVPALTPDDYCSILEYEPFTLYSFNDDALPGSTLAEHEANAITRLTTGEQFGAEQYLWGSMVAEIGVLDDATTVPVHVGLGYVEQKIVEAYGAQAIIHMDRMTATTLAQFLRVEGGRLTTILGTPVVVGGGYRSSAVTVGATGSILGTGPVIMYRGEIDTREMSVDRSVNKVSIVAQRDYVIGWDCVAVGAEVSLCNTCLPVTGG